MNNILLVSVGVKPVIETDIEELSKIPINILIELRDIFKEKSRLIRNQNFSQAAILRDREKRIYFEYEIPNINESDVENIIEQLRNYKINKILNEKEGNN